MNKKQPHNTLQNVLILSILFLSGFVSLSYEICWIRKAILIFGATTFALSGVVAIFFGGLALGANLFGKHSVKTKKPLMIYGLIEIGIGISAFINPVMFNLAETLYNYLYPLISSNFALLSTIRLLCVSLIILLPTILMGGILPLFCQFYTNKGTRILKTVSLLYAINTAGSTVGAIMTGFVSMPVIGVEKTILLSGVVNLFIGITILIIQKHYKINQENSYKPKCNAIPEVNHVPDKFRIIVVYFLFFLAGFTILGYEILWNRFLSLIIHNTIYTYTIVLSLILFGIFLGSILISFVNNRIKKFTLYFGLTHVLIGLSIIIILLQPIKIWNWVDDSCSIFMQIVLCSVILLIPAILSGVSFPIAIRMVVCRLDSAGKGLGSMTAINTLGGIIGSITVGFLLLQRLGMQNVLLLITGISLSIGFITILIIEQGLSKLKKSVIIIVVLLLWLIIPAITKTYLPVTFLEQNDTLIDYKEGLGSFLSIVKENNDIVLRIDRMWQGEKKKNHQILSAHIPMLLHQNPREVLVIGIGVGQSSRSFLMYDINEIDCVDIEESLKDIINKHFESDWLSDPRMRWIVEDGRNFVTYTKDKYDIISIEVGQIYRPNIASFYTVDFYKKVRDKLNNNGLVSQFVPLGFFDEKVFLSVVNSFLSVFPHSTLWYNEYAELVLVGSIDKQPILTSERLNLIQLDDLIFNDLRFSYSGEPEYFLYKPETFIANFLMGEKTLNKMVNKAPLYYDDRPVLEYQSAKYQYRDPSLLLKLVEKHLDKTEIIAENAIIKNLSLEKIYSIRRKNVTTGS